MSAPRLQPTFSKQKMGIRERRVNLRTVNPIIAVVLVGLVLVALGWSGRLLYGQVRTIKFVIPAGTQQQLSTGKQVADFPDEIVLTLGLRDTIVIENRDDVIHSFGPFVVSPHSTLIKRFEVPMAYEGACTFHQEQQMRLVVKPAPWDRS